MRCTLAACLLAVAWPVLAASAEFLAVDSFEYVGDDLRFAGELADAEYLNPVIAGFHPDPSVVRVGDDYYLVNSSFAYLPGIPLLHSRNLVDWQLLGHVIDAGAGVDFKGLGVSRGVFAPTIRHHRGRFYVISTAVDAGGNFIVDAQRPEGPWSAPRWLPEIDGIDPDLFIDTDGRAYIAHNGAPLGTPRYDGHRAIWLWEFDLAAQKVVPDSGRVIVDGGVDPAAQPIWIEGPHLYRIGEWYYLLCAEGGTGEGHSAVIFRSRALDQPFLPYRGNPILTQRGLPPDRVDAVANTGHADFVQAADGTWWSVFLGVRTYERVHFNTGRETFLLPVHWADEWPVILQAGSALPARLQRPGGTALPRGASSRTGNFRWRDEFDRPVADLEWVALRSADRDWMRLHDGRLWLRPDAERLSGFGDPAFLARRVQHQRYTVQTDVRVPDRQGVSVGLAIFQNETHHYYLGVRRVGRGTELFLEQAAGGATRVLQRRPLEFSPGEAVLLGLSADGGALRFTWAQPGSPASTLDGVFDGRVLSTEVAGGFVGSVVGLHARQEPDESIP